MLPAPAAAAAGVASGTCGAESGSGVRQSAGGQAGGEGDRNFLRGLRLGADRLNGAEARAVSIFVPELVLQCQVALPGQREKHRQLDQILQRYTQTDLTKKQVRLQPTIPCQEPYPPPHHPFHSPPHQSTR